MKKRMSCILMILVLSGCSSSLSTKALQDTKTVVLGSDMLRHNTLLNNINVLSYTEFKFLDTKGKVLGSKKYSGNFYKVKLDKNNYYLVSSDKYIKGSLSDQSEVIYNFDPSLNVIDSNIYLYEGDLYFIDNQGFRAKPTNYLTSIYKNNMKLFDIEDDQATSIVVMDSYIYVLTENHNTHNEPTRGILRNIYRYNLKNKEIEKMSDIPESPHYTSKLITDSERLYLYLYTAENVPLPDNIVPPQDRLIVIEKNMEVTSISDYKQFSPSFTSDNQNYRISNMMYIKGERHELRAINLNTMECRDIKLEGISDTAQYHYWSQDWLDSNKEQLVIFGNFESKNNYTHYIYELNHGRLVEILESPDVSAMYRTSTNE